VALSFPEWADFTGKVLAVADGDIGIGFLIARNKDDLGVTVGVTDRPGMPVNKH
jgi:hypothetical protein